MRRYKLLVFKPPGIDSAIARWYRLSYGLNDRGFESRQRLGIFLLTTESRAALEHTQPPINWVPGVLSLG
jgi:hypothetical protein